MIRALSDTDAGPVVMLGITRENVKRLMDGKPIHVTGESVNCTAFRSIVIFYGENEAVIAEDLREAGLITERTITREER